MPETILVVDDDPDIARVVEVNLRSAGSDVAVAADGEEALARATSLRPDLVLLDVRMPRIDGFGRRPRWSKAIGWPTWPRAASFLPMYMPRRALLAD